MRFASSSAAVVGIQRREEPITSAFDAELLRLQSGALDRSLGPTLLRAGHQRSGALPRPKRVPLRAAERRTMHPR